MRILGISDHITSGAALIEDGRIVAAVNEERLARKKMVMGFPRRAIEAVLEIRGVRCDQLDSIAVASQTGHFLNDYVDVSNGIFSLDEGIIKDLFFSAGAYAGFMRNRFPVIEQVYYGLKQPIFQRRRKMVREVMRKEFGANCPIEFFSHHHAHAATAYYASGYENALVVTLDAAGDGHCSHIYDVRRGNWNLLPLGACF